MWSRLQVTINDLIQAGAGTSSDGTPAGGGGAGGGAGVAGAGAAGQQVALTLQLNMQQLGLVNAHLFGIQSMSGAQVRDATRAALGARVARGLTTSRALVRARTQASIIPGAHGLFHLMVSGSKPQVDAARGLLSQVLGVAI